MKLLINYMEHVPQSIILNWVLSQKKLFFYLFFHKFFDNFSIQVDFNQVANNYWNKTMNMKKYFFILRAQILWKNCPLLGRSLLSQRQVRSFFFPTFFISWNLSLTRHSPSLQTVVFNVLKCYSHPTSRNSAAHSTDARLHTRSCTLECQEKSQQHWSRQETSFINVNNLTKWS
jgi:hypothetical protein